MKYAHAYPAAQRGMTLVLCLIFLALITLVSLFSIQSAITQERMAASQHDHTAALQAAEAALKEAERRLAAGGAAPTGWITHSSSVADQTFDARYRVQAVSPVGSRATSEGVELLEMLYRIRAQGFGRAEGTHVTLEALFVRQQRVET